MKQAMKQAINPPPARAASAAVPIHEQIYARFRAMIEQGQLCPGQKVSSLRALAIELGVARGTVQVAYDRLLGEGYLEARGPAGTFVSAHVVPARPPRVKHAPATGPAGSAQRVAGVVGTARQAAAPAATDTSVGVAPAARRSSAEAKAAATAPVAQPAARDTRVDIDADGPALLQLGLPALDAFPRKLWARLMAHEVRKAGSLHKPPAAGYRPLRDALAAYLHRSRGVAAQPEQIFVMPAYTASLALTVDALGLRGASAWVEHPGYPPTAQTLEGAGIDVCRVPVDADGLEVAFGRQRFADARLAVVTPSHQSPMGVALPLQRRIELLDWASESGAWIVEDDYDGEYRYRGHPLPALKSLDAGDNVIYCGTLSKVLYPGLRLSYLVAPHSLVAQFDAACRHTVHGGCPELQQAVAAEFIAQGHFARHIKRMRALYAQRRALLANALARYAHDGFTVHLQDGGMHLLVDVRDDLDDVVLSKRARRAGFGVHALSAWRNGTPGRRGLLMGFTNVRDEGEAERLVAQLMQAFELDSR